MKIFLFILFYFSQAQAASWTQSQIRQWDKTSQVQAQIVQDFSFGTFWGGLRRVFHWPKHKGNLHLLKPAHFVREVPVYIHSTKQNKDLYVFIPGVFGKPDGRISPKVIDALEEKDAHVAVIPNSIAPTYLMARPDLKKFSIQDESLYQTLLFEEILKTIDQKYIKNIHVIAESLGSFQVLLIKKRFHSLTLLWPPLYLDRAINRFDQLINERNAWSDKNCTLWWRWPNVLYETLLKPLPDGLTPLEKKCFGSWMIGHGFVSSIKETSESVMNELKFPQTHQVDRFRGFIKTFFPHMDLSMDKNDKTFAMVDILNHFMTPLEDIRMISSEDDFLNSPSEWEELKRNHPKLKEGIYLFKWGGHSGPTGLDHFLPSLLELEKKETP
jgi:hypothetical protein